MIIGDGERRDAETFGVPLRTLPRPVRAPGVHEDVGGFTLQPPEGAGYRVDVCDGLFDPDHPLLSGYCAGRQVVAFLSPTVERLYGVQIRNYLGARLERGSWTTTIIPTGEEHKTLASAEAVCAVAKHEGLDRRGLMMAVGGGIVCDTVGFAACMFSRGTDYIKVNTTLVGQVDVGVGIKVGVNALQSKNLFGAYHPAYASINDVSLLRTLPERQIRCGLSEIVKIAVIRDESLFRLLQRHPDAFTTQPGTGTSSPVRERILRTAMRLMLEELCPNLREHDLARPVDFGHTFSPTIEVASAHRIAHGEAVAIDMALSSVIARMLGLLSARDCEQILDLLDSIGLPVFDEQTCTVPLMEQAVAEAVLHRGRSLNLVVPPGLGRATFIVDPGDLPAHVVRDALSVLADRTGSPGGMS